MKVLISGGTGLIGGALTNLLLTKGYEVAHLSRTPNAKSKIIQYHWDVDRQELDTDSLIDTDVIINLAGASLNHRWTPEYKNIILRSRVDGTRLIRQSLNEVTHQVKCVISASAAGYYPDQHNKVFTESDDPGKDFLALVCEKWEAEALKFENLNIRTVRSRIGLVLSPEGGALPEITRPIRYWVGAALGSGRQLLSWIHINDLCRMFLHAIENTEMQGAYNFVGSQVVTNQQLTSSIAHSLGKKIILPAIPAAALKLVLGEMAEIVLRSNGLSNHKFTSTGFKLQFQELDDALTDLLK